MAVDQRIITELCARFERHTGINLHDSPVEITPVGESLRLTGEMDNIAMKRLAARLAAT